MTGFIGDMSGKAFADALKINSSLTRFSLRGCQCGVQTACAMAEAVEVNVNLKVLWLEGGGFFFGDAAPHFEKALEMNFTLNKLTVLNDSFDVFFCSDKSMRNHDLDLIESHVKLLCRKSQNLQAICDCLPSFPSMIFENFIPPSATLHFSSLAAAKVGGGVLSFGDNERAGNNIPSDLGGLSVSEVAKVSDLNASQTSAPGPD
eukprot:CAMPEP_0168489882 /NCGR_PEP_ID=MMETSP0228-20121227/68894_1 /TAXON_ID=133427 /ORGANISM="Protoceratium reticulatum, Strain CCCM 535 (=CCMP 1889)" /LENGTH=203 /DNA_ID=CAMNT_0008506571 /DNA_START=175 /DNA_END=784 /DNA_ORIENTATION=-